MRMPQGGRGRRRCLDPADGFVVCAAERRLQGGDGSGSDARNCVQGGGVRCRHGRHVAERIQQAASPVVADPWDGKEDVQRLSTSRRALRRATSSESTRLVERNPRDDSGGLLDRTGAENGHAERDQQREKHALELRRGDPEDLERIRALEEQEWAGRDPLQRRDLGEEPSVLKRRGEVTQRLPLDEHAGPDLEVADNQCPLVNGRPAFRDRAHQPGGALAVIDDDGQGSRRSVHALLSAPGASQVTKPTRSEAGRSAAASAHGTLVRRKAHRASQASESKGPHTEEPPRLLRLRQRTRR